MRTISKLLALLVILSGAKNLTAQQPQAQSGQPLYGVNAKYVNGVAPGYWPTAGSGLALNLSAGTAFCGSPPVAVSYAGGSLTMTASTTNYVFLDPSASCAPATSTAAFKLGHWPVATVSTNATAITSITDLRLAASPSFCGIDSGGNVRCTTLTNALAMRFFANPITGAANDNAGIQIFGTTSGLPGQVYIDSGVNSSGGIFLRTALTGGAITERMRITPGGAVVVDSSLQQNINTVAFSATPTFDASLGNTQIITLTANVTSSTLSNCAAGEWLVFDITEDATGGRTFVAPTNMKGFGAINTAASKHNVQMFYCDGTNAWAASPMQSN